MPKITDIYAFIYTDDDGDEDIAALRNKDGRTPMVFSSNSPEWLPLMRPYAIRIAERTGKSLKLVKFTGMEIIETFGEKH